MNNGSKYSGNEENQAFVADLNEILNEPGYANLLFISNSWTIGYFTQCEECGRLVMNYTSIDIPFENLSTKEFKKIMEEFCDNYFTKNQCIEESMLCHCNNPDYRFNLDELKWEYIDENEL